MKNQKNPVKGIIKKKYPHLNKTLFEATYFFVKYLINEKKLNKLLLDNQEFYGIDFGHGILNDLNINYKIIGEIPPQGRHIFTSNHPLGGIDGITFIDAVSSKNKEIKFVVADFISDYENYKNLFLSSDFSNGNKRVNTKKLIDSLKSEDQILVYPSGRTSIKIGNEVRDTEWSPSIINWATKYKRDIIPTYFSGRNSKLFYLLSDLRSKFGIKRNLEGSLMIREILSQKGKNFEIFFGKPISYKKFDSSKSQKEWAQEIYRLIILV